MNKSGAAPRKHEDEAVVTDVVLVRRIVERDECALAEAYDRYSSLVYSVALRILRDTAAAEEILQDIFYHLWNVATRFDSARGSLPAWLAVTSRHRAIDRLRRRRPEQDVNCEPENIRCPVDLEEHVTRSRVLERLRAALGKLPEAQRALVELAFFDGLTHSELASRTGDPLGTVKSRLRAAISALRKELAEISGATGS